MNCSVCSKLGKSAQAQCLIGGALARKGSVPVALKVQDLPPVLVEAVVILLGTGLPHCDGILRLQVTRVVDHR
jgi:hypothetical protein